MEVRMNKSVLLLLICLGFVCIGHAQQMIPVEDRMLRDSIAENAKRNLKQAGQLDVIRRKTKNTNQAVGDTKQLQYDYQSFLRQTTSTASLQVAEAATEQQAVAQTIAAAAHLDDYSFATTLQEVYAEQNEPMDKSRRLYEQLAPYQEGIVLTDLSDLTAYRRAQQRNVTALQEMSQRRKLQLAQTYRLLAERKVAEADELRVLLTTNEAFSMTEAERLDIIQRVQDYLRSSQQLQTKADALIQQASQPPFSKQQVLEAFRYRQERAVLSATSLSNE